MSQFVLCQGNAGYFIPCVLKVLLYVEVSVVVMFLFGSVTQNFKKKIYNCIVLMWFLLWEIWGAFPGESQLQQGHTTQPTVHAGCFSVCIIHQTLTWTTGSLTFAHGDAWTRVRESALKVDSGRKIPSHTRESNLCQRQWRSDALTNWAHPHPHVDLTSLQRTELYRWCWRLEQEG